ncbi:MAG: helix-turn-helix domain-containing protein [Micrococcales bacterium]|nr:helix-turn-helix domain-containing protein [Micrococcales bacterium]
MDQPIEDPPWLSLPAEIGDLLRPEMARIADDVIQSLGRAVPDYARPLEGRFGEGVRRGVEVAFDRFLELPGTAEPGLTVDSRVVYEGLGRGEVRMGRTLDALLAAYRHGARATFRQVSRVAMDAGLETPVLVSLGESILAYIEELSAASAEGYAAEVADRAGERDRLRAEVADLVVRGHGDEESVRLAAVAAGWAVPERVVVVWLPLDSAEGIRSALGVEAVVVGRDADAVAVLPEPLSARRRRQIDAALRERSAVVGPPRPLGEASDSLRLAMLAQTVLHATGAAMTGAETPHALWVDERLTELVLAAEPHVVTDLARARLAPLADLRPSQRERLTATLLAWLRHHGQRAPIARELRIHEQTVGYRLAQLREIFGEALDDPDIRFELELVLRAGHR